jgi:hypothetical protein
MDCRPSEQENCYSSSRRRTLSARKRDQKLSSFETLTFTVMFPFCDNGPPRLRVAAEY